MRTRQKGCVFIAPCLLGIWQHRTANGRIFAEPCSAQLPSFSSRSLRLSKSSLLGPFLQTHRRRTPSQASLDPKNGKPKPKPSGLKKRNAQKRSLMSEKRTPSRYPAGFHIPPKTSLDYSAGCCKASSSLATSSALLPDTRRPLPFNSTLSSGTWSSQQDGSIGGCRARRPLYTSTHKYILQGWMGMMERTAVVGLVERQVQARGDFVLHGWTQLPDKNLCPDVLSA